MERKLEVIQKLRVYPVVRDVTSVHGTISKKAGALIFEKDLPNSSDVKVRNVITLSPKQLDNLCSDHGIKPGAKAWNQLSTLITGGKAGCYVTSVEHKAGEKYIDGNGAEKAYDRNWIQNSADTIVLSPIVKKEMISRTIKDIMDAWDDELIEDNDPYEVPLVPETAGK